MRLGIITYDKPHLKTQELLYGLIAKGYKNIKLILTPFIKRKKRKVLINHRPKQFIGLNPKKLSKKFKLKIVKLSKKEILNCDYVLVAGSNLIDKKLIVKNKIINCHSGLIPESRGLDSLKWSIYNKKLIGNTLHFIDKNTDLGKIISHNLTPVNNNETIKNLSYKHYVNEIFMLINFELFLKNKKTIHLKKAKPTMRMPFLIEQILLNNYNNLRDSIIKKQLKLGQN